ncbi:glycosyltransferase [Xanthomonas phaseoli]|uniref:O-antigen biosynthesis protein n=1 Tax=Xanthomonas phaseoli pv. dieffenbachiae TaxID=92828 RepID=A0A1V9HEG2_9XANT|nr:glycosyltransferase [Xanthomonas phaseoli]MBO9790129.1 glycosyltransferase [Xanthomonas phaseoli pv. dieffenbachiae]MBO9832856.1 glycosyltransferase [Xanthomonas phaseoli pv. dieffenbachiae]MBO9835267.1 glycosyltransferase [Xanthomonas phaseoli pv. dieffenbachiae]MBO9842445.1 glycosyltransferase [Xanthomonas phaseoli pv. dieffenbachiae]MBO9860837.1 glycosyltransferase [Xanthomonas phaseoli pv. dieffenbachiae]
MPTYKPRFFGQALDSVLAQTYPALELVICDDNGDGAIEALLASRLADAPSPIRYHRNPTRLGELGSTLKGIGLAQGEYVKFLHDDDVLEPDCIAQLVEAIERNPGTAMASSRRRRIDDDGVPLPDILATSFPFAEDVLIDGPELVSFLSDHAINFIGEPSCVLCRRADLVALGDTLMMLNGKPIHWVGDLAIYVKLLRHGNLAFLASPLTHFRVSSAQFSQAGRDQVGVGDQGHEDLRQGIRQLGWRREHGDNRQVRVAPLSPHKARVFKSVDLVNALMQSAGMAERVSPATWLGVRHPSTVQRALIQARLQAHAGGPRIAVLLIDRHGDTAAVAATRDSLDAVACYQQHQTWVISSTPQQVAAHGERGVLIDAHGLATTLNRVIAAQDAVDWVLLVEAGSLFTTSGLMMLALEMLALPDHCQAVYADEVMALDNDQLGLALRPALYLDMLLSAPATLSRHWAFRHRTLLADGGFPTGPSAAFELDYQLGLIERYGLACIRHLAEPLLMASARPQHDDEDERQAIARHLAERGYVDAVVHSAGPGRHAVDYRHAQQPLVSILVLVDGRLPQVQRCLESILANTSYPHYEVLLLDRGTTEPDLHGWLGGIETLGMQQIRVLRFAAEPPREAVCNAAVEHARGEMVLWLAAGAAVMKADWLEQLLNHALRPEVGAVSGKLLRGDGTVHHAGMLLGLGAPAARAFEGAAFDESGYLQRLQLDQNYSALSGECLMLPRQLFVDAGGFAQEPALAQWSDVDLCLRLQQAGYLNVYAARAQLLIDPLDAPAAALDEEAMYARWLPVMANDPAYNPGFSLDPGAGFQLADPRASWRPLQSWRPLPSVIALPADIEGCGHYRVIQPLRALREAGMAEGVLFNGYLEISELARQDPDVVILQRQVGEARLEAMRRMKALSRAFKVYELDDYLPNLPLKNAHREHMPKDILKTLRRGLGMVDRFVVSTPALAEAFAGLHSDIRVAENRLPPHWWEQLPVQAERQGGKPRIGWAGGASHTGDLELIADVVKELADEVEWVFLGMYPFALRQHIHQFQPGVPIDQYPAALAALDLDLALAPVEQNLFNECKSNLRLLEYGACGYPVIASDVRCYQGSLPVTLVKNRYRDWIGAIREHLADLGAARAQGAALREAVRRDWMLSGSNLDTWRAAWLPD